jgi:hypothetical protein
MNLLKFPNVPLFILRRHICLTWIFTPIATTIGGGNNVAIRHIYIFGVRVFRGAIQEKS